MRSVLSSALVCMSVVGTSAAGALSQKVVKADPLTLTPFFEGFVEGFSASLKLDSASVKSCLAKESIAEDVVINGFHKVLVPDLWDTISNMRNYLSDVSASVIPVLRECENVSIPEDKREALDALVTRMEHAPHLFALESLERSISNGASVLDSSLQALTSRRLGERHAAGVFVSQIFYVSLFGSTELHPVSVMKGIALGLETEFPEIGKCVRDMKELLPELRSLLKKLNSNNPMEKAKALVALRKLYKNEFLPKLAECTKKSGAAGSEIARLEFTVSKMKNMSGFLNFLQENIEEKKEDIFENVHHAAAANEEHKPERLGYFLGLAYLDLLFESKNVELLTTPLLDELEGSYVIPDDLFNELEIGTPLIEAPLTASVHLGLSPAESKKFATGFVHGFAGDFPELLDCMDKVGGISSLLKDAIETISLRTPSDVLTGLKMLAETLEKDLVPTFAQCKGAQGEIKRILHAIQAFKNPKMFIFEAFKRLIINRASILAEIEFAVAAYKSHDFENMGMGIGEALAKVLMGELKGQDVIILPFESPDLTPNNPVSATHNFNAEADEDLKFLTVIGIAFSAALIIGTITNMVRKRQSKKVMPQDSSRAVTVEGASNTSLLV